MLFNHRYINSWLKLQKKKEKQIKKAEAKLNKVKKNVPEKKKRLNQNELQRGIVYIGHVPHGFYEEQMTEYFKQFGHVTRIRLARSKKVSLHIDIISLTLASYCAT